MSLMTWIAKDSLDSVRRWPRSLPGFYLGRASVAVSFEPDIETLAAYNEVKFLVWDYNPRHHGSKFP